MQKVIRQIAALAGILIMIFIAFRIITGNQYRVSIPVTDKNLEIKEIHINVTEEITDNEAPEESFRNPRPGTAADIPNTPEASSFTAVPYQPELNDDRLEFQIVPDDDGVYSAQAEDAEGNIVSETRLHIGKFKTVYDERTGGFTGDSLLLVMITVFVLTSGFLMFRYFIKVSGPDFYSYSSVHSAGFSFLALFGGGLLLYITIRHILSPDSFSMIMAYDLIQRFGLSFMLFTSPLVLVFAVLMFISNVALLRHESFRFANILGILIALILVTGQYAGFLFYRAKPSGSETRIILLQTIGSLYGVIFAYFECMLAGAILCGFRAAGYEPALDKDVIVILGCSFFKDGTLPPLLRGRVDKAIEFRNKQLALTKKRALFIPSGGQGRNEVMPEAQAMKNYLLSQGIPEADICVENRSLNTFQNMEYSKILADQYRPGGKPIFSTTNYHVFRSGVWASFAHFRAEGIGSRTKWWFWPNAFMRECVGLLKQRWKQELLQIVFLAGFLALLSNILQHH